MILFKHWRNEFEDKLQEPIAKNQINQENKTPRNPISRTK
jgi:hypothetical protein